MRNQTLALIGVSLHVLAIVMVIRESISLWGRVSLQTMIIEFTREDLIVFVVALLLFLLAENCLKRARGEGESRNGNY